MRAEVHTPPQNQILRIKRYEVAKCIFYSLSIASKVCVFLKYRSLLLCFKNDVVVVLSRTFVCSVRCNWNYLSLLHLFFKIEEVSVCIKASLTTVLFDWKKKKNLRIRDHLEVYQTHKNQLPFLTKWQQHCNNLFHKILSF